MKSFPVIKLDDIKTPIGIASLFHINDINLLTFPQTIDRTNTVALEAHYGTLLWPSHLPLTRINEFPAGPILPGYLLLSLEGISSSQASPNELKNNNRPRPVRAFLNNLLAGLAATLLIEKI